MGNFNPLSANPIKWSNTLKQFVGKLPTNCLSVFEHFVGLTIKGLRNINFLQAADPLYFNILRYSVLGIVAKFHV